jgi:hypothetical protein
MDARKIFSGLTVLGLIASFSLLEAQEKGASPVSNTACLACHGRAALPGQAKALRISEEVFSVSAHSALRCADCHMVPEKKAKGEIPHPKNLPDVNCTESCHRQDAYPRPGQSPLSYPDSIHGRDYLERGVAEVARCWDCHGKHNIKDASDPDSTINRKNVPLTCSRCHEDMKVVVKYHIHAEAPYQEYLQSVHGKALFEKGLLRFAAICTDCHGVHNIQAAGTPGLEAKKPETCGRCHVQSFNEYKESIHGQQALQGNIDAPLCVDCHGEHRVISPRDKSAPTSKRNVPDTCSACHARPEIMKKYGVPEDRIETFIESFHGIAIGLGEKAVASCTSCHGHHSIRPASDPRSSVNPSHLAKTCGQPSCHPGMSEKIARQKIHVTASQKKSGAPFYFQKFLLWSVLALALLTVLWFVPGFIRKVKLLKKR